MSVVAFTGHRPQDFLPVEPNPREWVRRKLQRELEKLSEESTLSAISGMALGVDQWAAELCVDMQIPFTAAIPFPGQEDLWSGNEKKQYHVLLQQAVMVKVVSPLPYSAAKMQLRNQWMVDRCDVLIAVFDGSSGGTANCVHYAERDGVREHVKLIRIDPRHS